MATEQELRNKVINDMLIMPPIKERGLTTDNVTVDAPIPIEAEAVTSSPKNLYNYKVDPAPVDPKKQITDDTAKKILQNKVSRETPEKKGIDWGGLGKGAMSFLGKGASALGEGVSNLKTSDLMGIAAGTEAGSKDADTFFASQMGKTAGQLGQQEAEAEALRQKLEAQKESDKARMDWDMKIANIDANAKAEAKAKGRDLPAGEATSLGDQQGSLDMLDTLADKLGTIEGLSYGPMDKARALNPYDTGAQSMNQLIAATKQVVGKGLEGGVLRAEDEKKYEKIIPKLGDTKEVLQNKAMQLRSMLVNKKENTLNSLSQAGFNVSEFGTPQEKIYTITGDAKIKTPLEKTGSEDPLGLGI